MAQPQELGAGAPPTSLPSAAAALPSKVSTGGSGGGVLPQQQQPAMSFAGAPPGAGAVPTGTIPPVQQPAANSSGPTPAANPASGEFGGQLVNNLGPHQQQQQQYPGPSLVPGGLATYHLLVMVDRDTVPHKLTVQVGDLNMLTERLQVLVPQQSISTISYWDEDFQQYVPMRSLEPLNQQGYRGKVHIATGGVKMVQVLEDQDALEWAALREQVDKLGPPKDGFVYELRQGHRIVHPGLEQAFQTRKKKLLDPTVRTVMLFYTNNARPSDQVVQHGFALPQSMPTQVYDGGIVFASDIDAQPVASMNNIKFLLCEVAVGRSYTVQSGDRRAVYDQTSYDSLLNLTHRPGNQQKLEEWVVFKPDQAIPRYVVTCAVVKGHMRTSWNPTALGCDQHPGETMKLWCVDCRRLMCPYCLTIGAHKGHNARDISEVAVFEKQVVGRMFNTLSATLKRRQNELAEIERLKSLQNSLVKKGEEDIRQAVRDLHQKLGNEEVDLLADLSKRKDSAFSEFDKQAESIQTATAELQKKYTYTKKFLEIPIENSTQARMDFLSQLQGIIDMLQHKPTYDDPTSVNIRALPQLHATVNTDQAQAGIESLCLMTSLDDHGGVGAAGQVPIHPSTANGPGGHVSRSQLSAEVAKVHDLQNGYIWVIPSANQHFFANGAGGGGMSKDIFSDVFTLMGCHWELRIAPQPADHISVFLHAAGHVHRMDFKVTIFSSRGWHSRAAKNWVDSFKGRGWGIKPYIELKDLVGTYIQDDMLKVCVTPTSGLY